MACGDMIISGVMPAFGPAAMVGKSSCGKIIEMTPFCACRD